MAYVTVAEWWWQEHGERLNCPTLTIVEAEESPPRFTGLLDARGNRIMVVSPRQPIGFVTFRAD